MLTHKVTLYLERETKGALRYEGRGEEEQGKPQSLIGTLYLRKAGLRHHCVKGGAWPEAINVTVSDGVAS